MMSVRRLLPVALLLAAGCRQADQAAVDPALSPPDSQAGVVSAPAREVGDSQSRMAAAYKAAHAKQDVEAMLTLYWFGDALTGQADDEMRQTIRENVVAEMRCPLKDIKIEPVEAGQHG